MKLTYKNIITALKFVTTASFIVALGFKLYNIYKYGGPKKPETPVEREDEDEDYGEPAEDYPASDVTDTYDSEDYDEPKEYTKN